MYKKYFSPASPDRAKVSVHLTAQAKPKVPSAEEQKTHALSIVSTILATEKIELDVPKLKSIITETASDSGDATAINTHILTTLTTQLSSLSPSLPQPKLDAVLDEARAALGLSKVEEKLEHPALLKETEGGADKEEVVKHAKTPVLITDVRNWKAGLCLSKGVKPVRDLADFMESDAKL
jgi:insulysin